MSTIGGHINMHKIEESEGQDTILIIGGGIAGIRAALDAASAGARVILVEKSPAIGGIMAFLDKTFPTLDCSICIEAPLIGETIRHPNIEVITLADVIDVKGEPGNFEVTILQKPRYVTSDCTKCGKCEEVCPVAVPNPIDGTSIRKAIYLPYPQAEPGWYVIDIEHCLNKPPGYVPCDRCKIVCDRNAIDFTMTPKIIKKKVASIILATGYKLADARKFKEYGYGLYPDVLTSLEFDRLLNASGPTNGEVLKPSNGEHVESILFASCAGSRDKRYYEYCSRFCCMYILKHALQAKAHGVKEVVALFMDIRAFGKGFESFLKRALDEGVEVVRGKLAKVKYSNGKLVAVYEDTVKGKVIERLFDMIVIAPPAEPPEGNLNTAKIFGIGTDKYGFFRPRKPWSPIETTRPGVYMCGSAAGPKDISDSVQEAGAAAALALTHVKSFRIPKEEYEDVIRDIEKPRVAFFVCHCGTNIAGVIDVIDVREYAKNIPDVVHSENLMFACSAASVDYIAKVIREKNANRLVVAACSPATHLGVFMTAARKAGLNPYLVEMANIRNLDSWVHAKYPREATEKAKDFVRSAIARARRLKPLKPHIFPVTRRVLVVGGGVAGMKAASTVAKAGIEAVLVEKNDSLGGTLRELYKLAPEGYLAEEVIREAIEEVKSSGVKVYLNTTVKNVEGFAGNFKVELSNGEVLDVGAIIIATGSNIHIPEYLGYGKKPNMYTLLDVEKLRYEINGNNIVFISCVGSRNDKRGCSRYCCSTMLHQALELKRRGKNVIVVYKDIRTYTPEAEALYREAASEGVLFLKVNSLKPIEESVIFEDGKVIVREELLGADVEVPADAIVLATALEPNPLIDELIVQLKIPKDPEGFLFEAHPKLGPVETPVKGVFIAGTAQGPKDVKEAIAQGLATAAKAIALLSKGYIEKEPLVAVIDQTKCLKCGLCARVCTYGAIKGEVKKYFEVIPALCEGCGSCIAECPVGAITMPGYGEEEILAQIEEILRESPEEKPIAFTCFWCSYAAADNAGIFKVQYAVSPRVIRLPCSSRVSWRLVKKAFELGAPAVAVTGCRLQDCHYQYANKHTVRRFEHWKKRLESLGVRSERFILRLFGAPDVPEFVKTMNELEETKNKVSREEIEETMRRLREVK
ncbi:MAG: FAD-dependent oxidoreductase [Acidilobaceae archaeon]